MAKNEKIRLPKELAEKWIAALRSKEYKQGKNFLYSEKTDCYCCLGVLGCVLGTEKENMNEFSSRLIGNAISGLPEDINFNDSQQILSNEYNRLSNNVLFFIKINDEKKKTFSEIADVIQNECELY